MLFVTHFITSALLWSLGTCSPSPSTAWEQVKTKQRFTLEQVTVRSTKTWSHELRRAYLKYGNKPPDYIEQAIAHYEAIDANGTTSVGGRSYSTDMEYLINAQVGDLNVSLNLDTGSADLWVFSTLQPFSQRLGRPKIYDPKRSGGKVLRGHTWEIQYGDGSGFVSTFLQHGPMAEFPSANGQVYLDSVGVGSISYPNQAIGAASKVSTEFARDQGVDGLMGLAFSKINSAKPQIQLTWFDNVKSKLAAPVFTCVLKRRQTGTYDFGFIDRAKYKGDLVWVKVQQQEGFWDFPVTGFKIGNRTVKSIDFTAMADTGTSLWYVPESLAGDYWSNVPGASWKSRLGGYTFPCNAKLPDLTIFMSGRKNGTMGGRKNITVPGINMNYQSITSTTCFGGLQRTDAEGPRDELHIAGGTFLKNLFVAFEHSVDGRARLGFARQA